MREKQFVIDRYPEANFKREVSPQRMEYFLVFSHKKPPRMVWQGDDEISAWKNAYISIRKQEG